MARPSLNQVVLVVGSLHHDIMVETDHLPRADETTIGSRWFPKFGGKGGNQAAASARAGASTRMFGAVGDDGFGEFLRHHLRAARVDDRNVVTLLSTGSGMSVAIMDASGNYAATIVSGANLLRDPEEIRNAGIWQDVGLLILQNEVPPALNLTAATEARSRAIPTVLNAAPSRELSADLVPLIDILVVNAVEAEMMGTDAVVSLETASCAARQLASRFASVIVTAGSAGLAGIGADGVAFAIEADQVSVVSTHGAGDAFIGVLAAALINGDGLGDAAAKASRYAGKHVSGQL